MIYLHTSTEHTKGKTITVTSNSFLVPEGPEVTAYIKGGIHSCGMFSDFVNVHREKHTCLTDTTDCRVVVFISYQEVDSK